MCFFFPYGSPILKLLSYESFFVLKNDIIDLVIYMKGISYKLVKFMLLGFSTLILAFYIYSSLDMWFYASFDNENMVSYVDGEEWTYLFFSIACLFQLILTYTLAFYYKINKRVLKIFNVIIFVLGALFLLASCLVDYKLYYETSFIALLIIIYYVTLLPGLLIFKRETKDWKKVFKWKF